MPKDKPVPRKNRNAVAMVRRRNSILTAERRSEIASQAAKARWKRKRLGRCLI